MNNLVDIEIERLYANPSNPRVTSDGLELLDLEKSIAVHGILVPLLVRDHPTRPGAFEIVAGHRRAAAAKLAGLQRVPALVLAADAPAQEIALVDNEQRENVHPADLAMSLITMQTLGATDQDIARRMGRSVRWVQDTIRLARLCPEAGKAYREGRFTRAHAVILAQLRPDQQKVALETVGDGLFHYDQASLMEGTRETKARSPREFQEWVDRNIRLTPSSADPILFPEVVQAATENEGPLVPITYEFRAADMARADAGDKILGCDQWRRAEEPDSTCPHSVLAYVAAGRERGRTLRVCLAKKECRIHWKQEIRAAVKRRKLIAQGKSGAASKQLAEEREKQKAAQVKKQEQAKLYQKALPEILKRLAKRVDSMDTGPGSYLVRIVVQAATRHLYPPPTPAELKGLHQAKAGGNLVARIGLVILTSWARQYDGPERFPKTARGIGLDLSDLLKPDPRPTSPKKSRQGRSRGE